MPRIFISYRREDSRADAGRIYDRLSQHFGTSNVFMDIDSLEPGVDFVEVLQRTVESCDVFLAVLGKQWLVAMDEQGRTRLSNPEDFVALEIGAALERPKIRLVPILVGGAHMPRSTELPDRLRDLTRRHALDLPDKGFHQALGSLIESIEKAEQERLAQEKAEAAAQRAEQERLAKAAIERLAKVKQERLERLAKGEQERLAQEKAEADRQAEQEKLAKAEQEQLARRRAEQVRMEQQRQAARLEEEGKQAAERAGFEEERKQARDAAREKVKQGRLRRKGAETAQVDSLAQEGAVQQTQAHQTEEAETKAQEKREQEQREREKAGRSRLARASQIAVVLLFMSVGFALFFPSLPHWLFVLVLLIFFLTGFVVGSWTAAKLKGDGSTWHDDLW